MKERETSWITPDPLGFEDGLNLYAYVHNNPLTYVDPDGQWAFLIPIAANLAISAAMDYVLPTVIVTLEQYAERAIVAASLSGLVNGYENHDCL